jgi:hypothetical protein
MFLDHSDVSGTFVEAVVTRHAQMRAPGQEFLPEMRHGLADGRSLATLSSRPCQGLNAPIRVHIVQSIIKAEQPSTTPPPLCLHSTCEGTHSPEMAEKERQNVARSVRILCRVVLVNIPEKTEQSSPQGATGLLAEIYRISLRDGVLYPTWR